MHSFITILTVATAALTAALPHANVHYKLHPVRRDLAAGRLTLAGRDVPTTYNLSPIGTCGSTTGYQCSPGMCCSQWGYCGTGPAYCGGAGGSNSTAPQGTGTGVPAYSAPASSAPAASSPAPAGSSAASSPASAATSAVVSPAGKGPASAHHRRPHHKSSASSPAAAPSAYSPPAGAPSGYSSPAGAPSAYSSATATGAASAPPAYTSSAQSAPATSAQSTSAPAQGSATAAPTGTASATPSSYSSPAPQSSSSPSSGGGSGANTYKMYNGDGSSSAGWPAESAWADFDSLWEANLPTIKISCAQFGQIENSDSENDDLKSAISSVGSQYGVDERFILAIIMQESKGCVRVDTTVGSVKNPGLMQSHEGSGTCYGDAAGACSSSEITQMVTDGTHGTSSGDGLQQLLAQCSSASGSQKYYEAARMYNSGSIAPGGDLGQGVATHCYAADIANRLTGWTTATCTCTLD